MLNLNSEAFLQYQTDGAAIMAAIRLAKEQGENSITIPRYNARRHKAEWRIDQVIRIPSHFTIVLDGCNLVMENGTYCNMFANEHFDTPCADGVIDEDMAIIGKGIVSLSGGVHNRLYTSTTGRFGMPSIFRNVMILFYNAKNVRVEYLHLERCRWVGMSFYMVHGATLKNIDFDAVPKVPMEGGITLFRGCSDFEFENITGRTGTDLIALRAMNDFTPAGLGVLENDQDIHDIKAKNLLGNTPFNCMFRFFCADGCKVYNLDLNTVMDSSDYFEKNRPHAAVGLGAGGPFFKVAPATIDDVHDITIKNVTSRGAAGISFNQTMRNVHISNVQTYGDIICGLKSFPAKTVVENCTVDHLFFGAGITRNCSNQFIGKMATGVQPHDVTRVEGTLTITDVRPVDGEVENA